MEDTIVAIATAVGQGGIAIIRLSGPGALSIADRLFSSRHGPPSRFPTHTIRLGSIGSNGELIDEVLLTVMRAPHTYTAEDIVEINCHGGLLTARKILELCLQSGARLAEPGEFTKRAFLNGRIDLTQAEAVADLIQAKTDRARGAAVHTLAGHLARHVNEIRDRLSTILAHIEAQIDFPEEDIAPESMVKLTSELESITLDLDKLLASSSEGKLLREGIAVAIVGRPNVGKSSLMNALLGHDRSIVTPIPGTTRDMVEDWAAIRGIPVRLADTAGIRKPRGTIEELGVGRSHNMLQCNDLRLHVVDSSRRFSAADRDLAELYSGKHSILVQNKTDLPRRLKLPADFPVQVTVMVSATRGDGIEELKDQIGKLALSGQVGASDLDVAINERHAAALRRALDILARAREDFQQDAPPEVVAQQLRLVLDVVGEIVGKTTSEDILNKIFSTFCIGK